MQFANINGLDRIMCDHDDGMIAKTIIYSGEESIPNISLTGVTAFYAYADKALTRKVATNELIDAFIKGCVVSLDGGIYAQPFLAMDEGVIAFIVEPSAYAILLAGDVALEALMG